jgi:hypothetical protein
MHSFYCEIPAIMPDSVNPKVICMKALKEDLSSLEHCHLQHALLDGLAALQMLLFLLVLYLKEKPILPC